MTESNSTVRNVSDTALWVAYFRSLETERPDALFRDPYAKQLAGPRGFQIANSLADGNKHEWAWVARTYLFDQFITHELEQGADMVLNLAAGLDARPYRMEVSSSVQWVEVDFPEIVSYKNEILANEKPRCKLERVGMDLSDVEARRKLFANLNDRAKRIVAVSEGLLIYFTPEDVESFAKDIASGTHFQGWIVDLTSPGQLKLMQRRAGRELSEANAAFKFGPTEGPDFFRRCGWEPVNVQGMLKTAASFRRAPEELLSLLPEPKKIPGNYPWAGVCQLKKIG